MFLSLKLRRPLSILTVWTIHGGLENIEPRHFRLDLHFSPISNRHYPRVLSVRQPAPRVAQARCAQIETVEKEWVLVGVSEKVPKPNTRRPPICFFTKGKIWCRQKAREAVLPEPPIAMLESGREKVYLPGCLQFLNKTIH